jgi:hypothetical protein
MAAGCAREALPNQYDFVARINHVSQAWNLTVVDHIQMLIVSSRSGRQLDGRAPGF